MRPDDPRLRGRAPDGPPTDILLRVSRLAGLCVGSALMIVSLVCIVRVFGGVYQALTHPKDLEPLVLEWSTLIGADELVFKMDKEMIRPGRLISVIAMGMGALVLASISGMMLTAGMKVVIAALDEHSLVNRVMERIKFTARGGRLQRERADSGEGPESNQDFGG